MKKRMVRITGCLLAGALSIGSFGLNTYAAPVAGVSSVTAVEIAEGQTPAAGVSQALHSVLRTAMMQQPRRQQSRQSRSVRMIHRLLLRNIQILQSRR